MIIFFKVNFKKLDYQIKINDKSKFIYNSSNKVIFYNDYHKSIAPLSSILFFV